MSLAQFRQIGVPDGRRTTAEVRRHLRRAQQRAGALLNRRLPPQPQTLLRTLGVLQEAVSIAYRRLQLQRLVLLQKCLAGLLHDVEQGVWFGRNQDAETQQVLREFYRDISILLHDLAAPRVNRRTKEVEQQFQVFLELAEQRGWRVPQPVQTEVTDQDGIARSCRYIQQVSVTPDQMLQPEDQFGLVRCALLLLSEQPIPEPTLVSWTKPPYNRDVYVVFGHYVVLPDAHLLGVHPKLASIESNEGDVGVDINRFVKVAQRLGRSTAFQDHDLIRYPRRVQHHYYCPVLNLCPGDRRYFSTWDVLVTTQEKQKDAHTNDKQRHAV